MTDFLRTEAEDLADSGWTNIQEVKEGLLAESDLSKGVCDGSLVILKGVNRRVVVGRNALMKINTSIGCSEPREFHTELEKLNSIAQCGYRPDVMMDLSIVRSARPLYEYVEEIFGGPVGVLPHYLCVTPKRGIDKALLMEEVSRQAEAGVAWMTLHLTVRRELYELAQRTRATPVTARGGGIVIRDMYLRNTSEGVLSECFPDILAIMRRHGTVLSLGTTFRPATVVDAMDDVHLAEMELQRLYMDEARRQGVQVMLEAIGHARLREVRAFAHFIREQCRYTLPVMTLGPIVTDAAVGEDHIANAIGTSFAGMLEVCDIANSITREEHTGRVPNHESILEGLRAARIASHAVNISRFRIDEVSDRDTADKRARSYTCVVEGGLFTESAKTQYSMGCVRCGSECPLVVNFQLDPHGRLTPRTNEAQ